MLTRFVRTQLIIFTIASIIGVTAMVVVYMQAPTLLGISHQVKGRRSLRMQLGRIFRALRHQALLRK